jgi:hypothetical protein
MAAEDVFGTGTTVTVLKVVGFGGAGSSLVGVSGSTAIGLRVVGFGATGCSFVSIRGTSGPESQSP